MHTYRPSHEDGKFGFRVGTVNGNSLDPTGPRFEDEQDAAAFCAFLNGGKYEPAAVEALMKPAADARAKAQKEREEAAKQEAEAEKARQLAAHPPAPAEPAAAAEADEEVEEKTEKSRRSSHAHAAKAKQHVKRQQPSKPVSIRKHK